MKLILAIAVLIGTYAPSAQAATYWVSTNGSDSNGCTHSARPLTTTAKLTVSAGVACAAAGDTVFIRAGTYRGDRNRIKSDVYTVNSGVSWSRPVTIAAYTGETVIIPYIAFPTNVRYVILDRLIVDAYGLNNNPLFIGCGSNHIRFQNGVLKNSTGPNASQGALIIGSDNAILDSLIVNNGDGTIPEGSGGDSGMYIKGDRNLIEGNEITGSGWGGIQVYDSDGICDVGADFNIIRRNRIHNNHRNSPNHAALLIGSGDGNIAVNNIVYNEDGDGISVNYSPSNNLVYNNTIYNVTGNCIYVGAASANAILKNNILRSCGNTVLNNGGGDTVQTNNLTADPSFTNPSVNDFTLVCATSAARNAGTNLTAAGVTTDYSDTARPQGLAFDIGAYECPESADGKLESGRTRSGRVHR